MKGCSLVWQTPKICLKQGLAEDVCVFFCHHKQSISSSLPPHTYGAFPETCPWVVAEEGAGGQLAWDTETGNKFTVFISRDSQNNWELALSSPSPAQLFAAPEPLLSPSGHPDHWVVHRDAVCVCKSLLRLPVNKAVLCTLHLTLSLQNSPWWTDVQVSESVWFGFKSWCQHLQATWQQDLSAQDPWAQHHSALQPSISQASIPKPSISAPPSPHRLLPHRYPHRWLSDLTLLWLLGKVARPSS